ncbi:MULTISPECIES: extracellular solute-binding protein [Paenibacillus]|uniref:extracellular solute-binding protein n=1 Tax=Paenibacillus TaxID=44249 RepID=UPI0004F60757|nr:MULTISPECIES: extracellular solute-binding protein [Paenibacillus]AIQ72773.1 ABC transporter substrate-binding protein [Paenibacillus odorifer]MDH6425559.1 raffinose/stachyose/melibiose transport system substrate-binding protein [Paenibacillus sp. PastH-4]MDH6441579.1 raffinose/stachyose/melibiose transport system substrate-binding protein [Paenibacillus sp. PastF-4]MDH6529910.1 raffinose/stachyose/melibiose transport system substrate-binding protein [Paenibacillus sp. PastH-3]MEC0132447.1 
MRNKKWTILFLTMCLVLVTAGCGQKDNNAGESKGSANGGSDKVTVNFMHLWPEGVSAGQNKIVNQIIKEYQTEHPNVVIKQEVLDNEQYKNKLKVLSASNELPDVGVTWAAGFLQPYVEGNLFAPVDDLLNGELKDKFVAGTTEAYAINDKTYALPLEFNIAPIYYNKAIFEKYNLEVPQTYDQFKQVVKTLSDGGIAPIALGNKDRWTGSLWYMYLADRIAGQQALAGAISGSGSFMDEGLVKAASEVQSLVDSNAFVKGFNGLSNEEAKSEFVNGKAAMYMMGSWDLPNFTTNEEIPLEFRNSVGFFKFPTVEGGKGDINSWVGGPGVGLFVAENSEVKEEAKLFVEYFVSKWGEQSVTGAGVIPATKVDTATLDLPQLYIDLFNEMNKASSITLFADVQMRANAAETHLNMIQALFGKAVTPEKYSEEHDAAISKGN